MGTSQPDSDSMPELDDSGCVQDDMSTSKASSYVPEREEILRVQLLDFSDDVLLYIFKHCSARDLKALGFTCSRLSNLIRDHSLWHTIDYRDQPCSSKRLKWLMENAINSGTKALHLSGYANQIKGCLGYVHQTREEAEQEKTKGNHSQNKKGDGVADYTPIIEVSIRNEPPEPPAPAGGHLHNPPPLIRQHARFHINTQHLPIVSLNGTRVWPDESMDMSELSAASSSSVSTCSGPVFTLDKSPLQELSRACRLTEFTLERANVNCNTLGLSAFPKTLQRLSLRGTNCFNLQPHKSFLFRIHDYLPELVHLDLSECEWLEPSSFLPLSKMPKLRHLILRDCRKLSEFVAYASLATRYGFKKLKVLDLRGSPVGDSEVSALGWLWELEELYLSPMTTQKESAVETHSHYKGEGLKPIDELDEWEKQDPFQYRTKDDTISEQCCDSQTKDSEMQENDAVPSTSSGLTDEDRERSKRKAENGSGDGGDDQPDTKKKKGKNTDSTDDNQRHPRRSVADRLTDESPTVGRISENCSYVHYVRFRQNEMENARPNEMRERIFFFNVGRPLHRIIDRSSYNPQDSVDATQLVTDAAIRRFGRSEDNVNYINIGPQGLNDASNGRSNRSNLRVLSVVGYRSITDWSLIHLVNAAPHLVLLDVTDSLVTKVGVERFKLLRPDCKVVHNCQT